MTNHQFNIRCIDSIKPELREKVLPEVRKVIPHFFGYAKEYQKTDVIVRSIKTTNEKYRKVEVEVIPYFLGRAINLGINCFTIDYKIEDVIVPIL